MPIKSFYDDKSDTELEKMAEVLENLSYVNDVRDYIREIISLNQVDYERARLIFNEMKLLKNKNSQNIKGKYKQHNDNLSNNINNNNISTIKTENLSINEEGQINKSLLQSNYNILNNPNQNYFESNNNDEFDTNHILTTNELNENNFIKNSNSEINNNLNNNNNNSIGNNLRSLEETKESTNIYNKETLKEENKINIEEENKTNKENNNPIINNADRDKIYEKISHRATHNNSNNSNNRHSSSNANNNNNNINQLKILHVEKIGMKNSNILNNNNYNNIYFSGKYTNGNSNANNYFNKNLKQKNSYNISRNAKSNNLNVINNNNNNNIYSRHNFSKKIRSDTSKENSLGKSSFLNNSNTTKNSQKSEFFKLRSMHNYKTSDNSSKKNSFLNSERVSSAFNKDKDKERESSANSNKFGFSSLNKNKTSANFFNQESKTSEKNLNLNINNLKHSDNIRRPSSVTNSKNNLFKANNFFSGKSSINVKSSNNITTNTNNCNSNTNRALPNNNSTKNLYDNKIKNIYKNISTPSSTVNNINDNNLNNINLNTETRNINNTGNNNLTRADTMTKITNQRRSSSNIDLNEVKVNKDISNKQAGGTVAAVLNNNYLTTNLNAKEYGSYSNEGNEAYKIDNNNFDSINPNDKKNADLEYNKYNSNINNTNNNKNENDRSKGNLVLNNIDNNKNNNIIKSNNNRADSETDDNYFYVQSKNLNNKIAENRGDIDCTGTHTIHVNNYKKRKVLSLDAEDNFAVNSEDKINVQYEINDSLNFVINENNNNNNDKLAKGGNNSTKNFVVNSLNTKVQKPLNHSNNGTNNYHSQSKNSSSSKLKIKKVDNYPRHSLNSIDLKKVIMQDPFLNKLSNFSNRNNNFSNTPITVRNISSSQKFDKKDLQFYANNIPSNNNNNNFEPNSNINSNTNTNPSTIASTVGPNTLYIKNKIFNNYQKFEAEKQANKINENNNNSSNNENNNNNNKNTINEASENPNVQSQRSPQFVYQSSGSNANATNNYIKHHSKNTIEKVDDFLKINNVTATARNNKSAGMFVYDPNNKSRQNKSTNTSKEKYSTMFAKKCNLKFL